MIGCQSAAQYDQVARELRMQEDELYAMQDYLEEYQQLVCKYRTENAALKRQLAENGVKPVTESPQRANGNTPARQERSLDVTPPATSPPANQNIQPPDVPPLGETTSGMRGETGVSQAVVQASAEVSTPRMSLADVWLRGEVVPNEEGGGPRMVVEVVPLTEDAVATTFHGAMSLMLVAAGDHGEPVNVARWDYRPKDVQAATEATNGESIVRFQLELPADSAATEAREIWVQLLPRGGERVLAHTGIDLMQPGLFTSRELIPHENLAEGMEDPAVVAAMYEENESNLDAGFDAEPDVSGSKPTSGKIFDGGWTIAKPGRPGGLTEGANLARSDWRATAEPVPTVESTEMQAPKPMRVSRSRDRMKSLSSGTTPPIIERKGWSPDRDGSTSNTPRTASTRPTWSATR